MNKSNNQNMVTQLIDRVESNLILLSINIEACKPYNDLYNEASDLVFLAKLQLFDAKLTKLVNELKSKAA